MSGIYIPDMEKPKCCFLCPLCYNTISIAKTGYCRLLFEENEAVEGGQVWRIISDVTELADFCPLVAVPDHGRLIDADKLKKQIEDEKRFSAVYEKATSRYLDNAPTIIPADEEDNDGHTEP